MFKYLELAVDLRKSYIAKEGIFQYKLICQQTNIKSFEDVVRRYIDLAEEKAEWAKNKSVSRNTDEVDDLDVVQSPEEILLSAVSSENQEDRSERVKLIPWVRFLWEAYRQCLDILKNNVRTEALYHEIAHRAFQFCTKFNRKTEFRKLCDNLRAHMDYLRKTQLNAQPAHTQSHMVNLNNPESLAMHLETRLIQLESATQIELWQEAYRATDDIKRYGLMNLNKKPPKPQLMANYYQKLALVFWKADCHLFHAAALFRLFHLTRELKKTITQEEIQKMASKLVIATLTIPIPPNRPDIDKLVDTEENTVETHQRNLASLLGLTTVLPTRSQLIKDLKRMGYIQHAYPQLQELYNYLEVDFNPLAICSRVENVIKFIDSCEECPDIKNYTNSLKNIAILRLLKGVSQVYQTIEYDRLSELCPFADKIYLETMVVEAARRNDLQVRIDHRRNSLHFGTELCASQSEEIIEGPHLQSMPSEQVRLQLVNTYSTLLRARAMIQPDVIAARREKFRVDLMYRYLMRREAEHDAILARHSLIEERKKQLEILGVRMEQEERLRQEAKQRKLAEEESQRIQLEKESRERRIEDRKTEQIETMAVRRQIQATDMRENMEQAKKEQKELFQKQRRLERKIDHLERAKRLEEIPLLEKEYEKWREVDRKIWEECEAQRIADILAERELAKTLSQRLHKLKGEAETFASRINAKHQQAYEEKLGPFQQKLEEERVIRMEARIIKRREERRAQWIKEKEKAEEDRRRQKEDEERRKMREEEDRRREQAEREEAESLNWRRPESDPMPPPPAFDPSMRGSAMVDRPRGFGARPISSAPRVMAAAGGPPSRMFDSRDVPDSEPMDWRSGKAPAEPPAPPAPEFDVSMRGTGLVDRARGFGARPVVPPPSRGLPVGKPIRTFDRDPREAGESRDFRDLRAPREPRESREPRERDFADLRAPREAREQRDFGDLRGPREPRETREPREPEAEPMNWRQQRAEPEPVAPSPTFDPSSRAAGLLDRPPRAGPGARPPPNMQRGPPAGGPPRSFGSRAPAQPTVNPDADADWRRKPM